MTYKRIQGIYRITNSKTGYCYIGSSTDIRKRFNRHKKELNMHTHHNLKLQRSYNKFGKSAFVYEVVCTVRRKESLIELEHSLINSTEKTYNIGMKNNDNLTKHPRRKSVIKKISKSIHDRIDNMTEDERKKKFGKKGASNPNWKGGAILCPICKKVFISRHNKFGCNNCYCKNREGENNPFYGKSHSNETIEKISKSRMGQLPSNSVKVKIGNIVYDSNTQAAKAVGCAVASIANRCRNDKFPEYSFVTDRLERPSKSQDETCRE